MDEDTMPVAGEAKAKGPIPRQLRPDFRTPKQRERLIKADQEAWSALARFRFASATALQQLHYSNLGFEIGEYGFKGRVQRHISKGFWVSHRLGGGRPDSVVSLTRKGAELFEETYGTHAPAWNVDSARRGWLRSTAWAGLSKAGWVPQAGIDYLRVAKGYVEGLKKQGPGPHLDFANLIERAVAGEPVVVPFDYCREGSDGKGRVWLFVEEPHKSVESQIDTLKVFLAGLSSTMTRDVIYRPVDELSAWNPKKKEWVRRSGRLAKALSLMKEANLNVVVSDAVPHMQVQD